ncbi:MAG TPA: NAD(P)/FAD-dependent oxidoreductase [Lacibacter sp.]|nr:NAD(P)/FAD-dependent oxidoreductase [Lacibacter sp.]HMO88996.1 NAD(P)/FAD-dependent oxidoreductase [Lacibacter sp.]
MKAEHPILVVIGGGAAGFFCAVNAARLRPGLQVLLLEKSSKVLSKVRISGGGRCNLTHACFDREEMSRRYYRGTYFIRKAFHRFFTPDTIEWFTSRGVLLKTEADGRMFPQSDSSQTIVDCLMRETNRYGVDIRFNASVNRLVKDNERWQVFVEGKDQPLFADFVCITTGGYPKEEQFRWLLDTGHRIVAPVPSLFTFNLPGHTITSLMGISVPRVSIRIQGTRFRETGPVLITHWGLSGPCVLKLSAAAARELQACGYSFTILVNWLEDVTEADLKQTITLWRNEKGGKSSGSHPPAILPNRLWLYLLQEAGIASETRWADVSSKAMNKLVQLLVAGTYAVSGKTTFKEEFVTAGGVDLRQVDVNTMQSKLHPGLYFAGEVLDVDGVTGGFNFQHAWTSGYIAASAIATAAT